MAPRRVLCALLTSLALMQPLWAANPNSTENSRKGAPLEPSAGSWQTWVISSGKDLRVPPPPTPSATQDELRKLEDLISHRTDEDSTQIAFWDAGAPASRWIDLLNSRMFSATPTTAYAHRVYTYVALAMYDATVATWESKYFYNRPRPSQVDRTLDTALPIPNSPSYPSEHAAAAQAAATVLGYLLPAEAQKFQTMAEQAGWSRVVAGLQYPSDYEAGLALGRQVGEQVIAKAMADGSSIPWAGTVPVGPCKWSSATPPGNAAAATWKPLLLTSPAQFRPEPPPACDSPEGVAEVATVRNFARTFVTNYKAFYWQSPDGLNIWPYRLAEKWIAEDRLDQNPPRVARAYALIAAVMFDAFIASQDGKVTYWYPRPHMVDSAIVPIFPAPNFPAYPSNHATFSTARSEVMAYLFPTRADFIRSLGKEGGDSRVWAGIHFPMDLVAGNKLGKSVAQVFIERASRDGSQ